MYAILIPSKVLLSVDLLAVELQGVVPWGSDAVAVRVENLEGVCLIQADSGLVRVEGLSTMVWSARRCPVDAVSSRIGVHSQSPGGFFWPIVRVNDHHECVASAISCWRQRGGRHGRGRRGRRRHGSRRRACWKISLADEATPIIAI